MLKKEFGQLSLLNGDLVGQNGVSLTYNFDLAAAYLRHLNLCRKG